MVVGVSVVEDRHEHWVTGGHVAGVAAELTEAPAVVVVDAPAFAVVEVVDVVVEVTGASENIVDATEIIQNYHRC